MRMQVRDFLVESGCDVLHFDDHPFGLGVFKLVDNVHADTAIGLTFEADEITTMTFCEA